MVTIAYDQSVRQLMQGAGYDNNKIGYDTNSGYVTYDNKPFMKPQVDNNGTTFTDQPSFQQAHQSFQNVQKQANPNANYSWMNSAEDSMDIPQRFAYYTSNPDKGQSELQRVNTKIGYLNGIANYDPQAAQDLQSANQYKQSLMSVLGPQQQAQQQTQQQQSPQLNDLIGRVYQQVTNPQAFDVYGSPQYAAAKSASDYAAQQAIRQAQESMGQSGFGRSTNLADRSQLIQNDANQRLLSQVVPQLIQQHNELQQQQTGNLMGLISPLMQNQQFDKTYGLQRDQYNLQKQGQEFNQNMDTSKFNFDVSQAGVKNAFDSVAALGYVNADASKVLGVPEGTTSRAMQQLINDMNYKNAELGLKQQSNDIAQQRVDNQSGLNTARSDYYKAKSQPTPTKETANQYTTTLNRMFTAVDPDTKKVVVTDPTGLEKAILGLGLSDAETSKLYSMYGLQIPQ